MRVSRTKSLQIAFALLLSGLSTPLLPAAGFIYSDFSSISGLNLVASAVPSGSDIRISPSSPNTVGSVWHTTKQNVENGFETMFTFRFTNTAGSPDVTGNPGGDGLAFLVQNTSSSAFGIAGSYMGYEVPNSVAVEFDTWQNSNFIALEPSNNHVGVQSGGPGPNGPFAPNYLGAAPVIPNMSDGAVHTGMVRYLAGAPGLLSVFVDNMVVPVLTIPVDLSTQLNLDLGTAFVGFTAGGAGAYENHDLLSWKYRSVPEPSSAAIALCAAIVLAFCRAKLRR